MPGITRAVNVSKENLEEVTFGELGLKEGFDVGLEMSGNPHAFKEMISLMMMGGKVSLLGKKTFYLFCSCALVFHVCYSPCPATSTCLSISKF